MQRVPITTRRELLSTGLGLIGIGSALPGFLVRTALAGPDADEGQRVLVVLQLHGGNDSLSTLIPYGHKRYYEVRQEETAYQEDQIIKLNDELGLHPNMVGSKALWDEGQLAIINGVGMPNNNYLYALAGDQHTGLTFHDPAGFRYHGDRGDERRAALYRKLNELDSASGSRQLDWVAGTAMRANEASEAIQTRLQQYTPKTEYPDTALGRNLRSIAGLIAGGLSTRVYWTRRDGFDTHTNQRGPHHALWKEIDDALVAFFNDLKAQQQAERVLVMYYSEFSRTTRQNGLAGTDHAHAGVNFLWGPGVRGGIYGEHPSLEEEDGLNHGNALKHTTDYRSLYATVLENWLQIPSDAMIEPNEHGESFPSIHCIR